MDETSMRVPEYLMKGGRILDATCQTSWSTGQELKINLQPYQQLAPLS